MKHVCMVAYTNYRFDGRVRREAEAVATLPGYSVTVLTYKEKGKPATFEMEGVLIRELDIPKYRGENQARYILSYVGFTFLAFLECTKRFARKSLDVLHVHNMPNFVVFAGLIPWMAGRPIILDVHDTMVETYAAKFGGRSGKILKWALRIEESISCRMARRIVCVNDIQKEAMVRRNIPEEKILVVMNVPDPGVFDPATPVHARLKEGGKFRMIFHGTVAKRIGVDLVARAISRLNGNVPGMEFHLVGDGDDLADFKELSRSLGVDGKVHVRGKVPLEVLPSILKDMDLGIVPNGKNIATELMLPVKMLEYIALGIPVVAPRLRTISHYFTEDMVFFFEPDDVDSMGEAIRAAFRSEGDRLNRATEARRFLDKYGWEHHKKGLTEMYQAL
ncbi:glycosyltransferase family 4 protein [Candidatus Deferrimicrobium sp.]|uniref:glycosyltransferase family 4 protein n=1 Tax=Candidatus Deferrimicrobium sp. TaxID=3060586 RepID=UPI003C3F4F2D